MKMDSCIYNFRVIRVFYLILFLGSFVFSTAKGQRTFYVDAAKGSDINNGLSVSTAFKTIAKAQAVVRTINTNMNADITVYLRGGDHVLSSTLTMDDRDAGTNGFMVIYSAFPNETPIIRGDKKITGWTLFDSLNNIYKASSGVAIQSRQLFVDGRRATRARRFDTLQNIAFDSANGHTTSDWSIVNWKNASDIEMVYKVSWTNPRCGINNISVVGNLAKLTMKQPGWKYCTNKGLTSVGGGFTSSPWYIENAYEFLDSSGEWYLDRTGAISGSAYNFFYKPFLGEEMKSVDVSVPVLEKLVVLQGRDISRPIHHIKFSGITFQYTTWLLPSGNNGLSDAQNNILRWSGKGERIIDGAAIVLGFAKSILVEGCKFTHLGGMGVEMYSGCQENKIEGCSFSDISANAIQVGDVYGAYNDTSYDAFREPFDARLILKNNDIVNNYIADCGVEYRSSCAIAATFPQNMNILHNEIANMPYSGIHIGWGQESVGINSSARNTVIRGNYIHNMVAQLDDAAGLYTCGPQDTLKNLSFIDSNYQVGSHDNGLYFDGGSCWWSANNNVFDDITTVNINISSPNGKANPQKHDITVANTYATTNQYWNYGTRTKVAAMNVVANGNWNTTAKYIIDNAGLQSDYIDIRGTVYLDENFNDDTLEKVPANWGIVKDGGTIIIKDSASSGDRVMTFSKISNGKNLMATKSIKPVSGKVIIYQKLLTNANSGYKTLPDITDRNGIIAASLVMKDGNIQLYKGNNTYLTIQPFVNNRWYLVKMILNTETNKLDVFVDGLLKVYQDNFRNVVSEVAQLKYSINASDSVGFVSIDNIKVIADRNFINEDYSGSKIGVEPLGWAAIDTAETIVVDTLTGNNNRILRITKTAVNRNVLSSKTVNPIFGKIVATCKVMVPTITGQKNLLQLYNRYSSLAVGVLFKDGNLQTFNGSSNVTIQTFKANIWYKLKLVLNTETDKYEVYVNDTLKKSALSFRNKIAEVSKIEFGILTGFVGTLFIDDVQLFNTPSLTENTLPVKLVSFVAKPMNENKEVAINWITASAVKNNCFVVEHSINSIDFTMLDSICSNSYSSSYSTVDRFPNDGINYYRLKQVDVDGSITYSECISVNLGMKLKDNLVIFPNPAKGMIHLNIKSTINQKARIFIYDNNGRIVQNSQVGVLTGKGQYGIQIDNLSKGVYFVTILLDKDNLKYSGTFEKMGD